MEGSEFIFDLVKLVYYKCHNVNFCGKFGSSFIDSPE